MAGPSKERKSKRKKKTITCLVSSVGVTSLCHHAQFTPILQLLIYSTNMVFACGVIIVVFAFKKLKSRSWDDGSAGKITGPSSISWK